MSTLAALALLALPQAGISVQSAPSVPPLDPSTYPGPWIEAYGGGGADWLVALAPRAGGGVFAAGYTFSFGAGAEDAWVARVEATGQARWELALGGAGADQVRSVAATPDGGCLLAGSTSSFGAGGSDGWLVKLGKGGQVLWERTYGTSGEELFDSVALVPDAGSAARYYVAGTADVPGKGRDAWVLALDDAGVPLWQETLGGKLDDDLTAMAATPDGLVFVTFSQSSFGGTPVAFGRPWLVRLNAEGNPVSQRTFDFSSGDVLGDIVALEDGTFATTGEVGAFGFFRGDVWVQRLDADLDVLWDRRFGDNFLNWVDAGSQVRPAPGGGLLVIASTETAGAGSQDLWLLRLDGAGNLLADRTFGGAGFDSGQALAVDEDGLAFVGGTAQLPPTGGSFDASLARVTAELLHTSAGTSCAPVLPTQPNIWTTALTVEVPGAVPAPTAVSAVPATSAVTVLDTGFFLCR